MHPIKLSRYVRQGGPVEPVPRVSRIGLSPIDLSKCQLQRWDQHAYARCLEHENCNGHLIEGPDGSIALSNWCMSLASAYKDPRGSATLALCTQCESISDYGRDLRKTLMTKSGHIRYHCTGFIAIGSIRGVAVPVWDVENGSRKIFINREVMKKVKIYEVPVDKEQDLTGRYHKTRCLVDGDWAILGRCPASTERSIQAVQVYGWDHWAIGVSPEMCNPLHLDFDGDEVHVFPVSRSASLRELERSANFELLQDIEKRMYSFERAASTTITLGDLMGDKELVPEHLHMGYKPHVLTSISTMLKQKSLIKNFIPRSKLALNSLISSHHRVSEGYCMARDMRYMAGCVKYQGNQFEVTWQPEPSRHLIEGMYGENVMGLPGASLAARMANLTTQKILDSAKHKVVQASGSHVKWFLTEFTYKNMVVKQNHPWNPRKYKVWDWLKVVIGDNYQDGLYEQHNAFDVGVIRRVYETYGESCLFAVAKFAVLYVCQMDGILPGEKGLLSLTLVVMACVRAKIARPLTSSTGTSAFRSMGCAWYYSLLIENMKSFEVSVQSFERQPILVSQDLVSSVLSGNWNWSRTTV